MNKLMKTIMILLVIGGIAISIYFITDTNEFLFRNKNKTNVNSDLPENFERKRPQNLEGGRLEGMQKLTEEQILEVQEFFNSNPDNGEIKSYCQENRMYCGYYCTQINPNHEYCENMSSQRSFNGGFRK